MDVGATIQIPPFPSWLQGHSPKNPLLMITIRVFVDIMWAVNPGTRFVNKGGRTQKKKNSSILHMDSMPFNFSTF